METLPRDIGRFVIERLLGAGGMAKVYVGWQKPPMKRDVAIKVIQEQFTENPAVVERFRREAASSAQLDHENIVRVIDFGELLEDGGRLTPYIVMELVKGTDLGKLVRTQGRLPLEVSLLVVRDVARALQHAHEGNVIHRDIKPSNVMLTTKGTTKLMDFGLARAADDVPLTRTGDQMGSPPYMSPEQAEGRLMLGHAGQLSDIFSMGSLSYHLLVGEPPFPYEGRGLAAVLDDVRHLDPVTIARRNPLVPRPLAETLTRAMDKDPGKRCPSMSVITEAAESALAEAGVTNGRTLLSRYLEQPTDVGDELSAQRLTRHLEKGRELLGMGAERKADALREFQCALHLQPGDKESRRQVERLEKELADDPTVIVYAPPRPAPRPRPNPIRLQIAVASGLAVLSLAALIVAWAVQRKEPRPEPPTPPPVPTTTDLVVLSDPPHATVVIDGAERGTTPITLQSLPLGAIHVVLAQAGFDSVARQLALGGGTETLSVALTPVASFEREYAISTSPSHAQVYLDGAKVYLAWPMRAKLKEGSHRFTVMGEFGKREFTYQVRRGDPVRTLIFHYDTGALVTRR